MYSLFLCTSALSYLTLLRALERGDRRAWALWALAILATVATHPYGALVLASQAVFVLVARRDRLRQALWAFGAVAVLGIPFWLTDLVLAGRFDAGVAGGGRINLVEFVWQAGGDFTAAFPVLPAVLVAAAAGVAVLPRETRLLAACAAARAAARARRRAQLGLAGDTAPDLPPPLPGAGGRRGTDQARPCLGAARARRARLGSDRLGLGPDARSVRVGARRPAGGARRRGRVSRRDDAAWRRAARLRPALPAGVGATVGLPARGAAARGRRPRAPQPARARPPAGPRRLGLRREQDDELRALDGDRSHLAPPGFGLRGARLRPLPDHPHPRAGA